MKIIDFGMAQFIAKDKFYCTMIYGTDGFIAPEVLSCQDYAFKSDIYGLAISFCIMVGILKFFH